MTMDVALPDWCQLVRADNPGPMTLDGTNTYVVRTGAGHVVIDPGPSMESHLATVAGLGPVVLAVLTHHHGDHSGGAARFSELSGAPVVGRDPDLCTPGWRLPGDGGTLDVPGLTIRVLDSPGHTADSISLLAGDGAEQALFSGDTVLGRGTTVISHPDGDLGAYLDSLSRLRSAAGSGCLLLPGHGPVRDDAGAVITRYIAHRAERLDQVSAALATGAHTAREVTEIVYADLDPSMWPIAERTVEAALAYLRPAG